DAARWRKARRCATCHHGTMTVWALSEARSRGYAVDAETGLVQKRPFQVLTRQCLGRRIKTAEELRAEIAAWERGRNEAGTRVDWCFRVADARRKLHWIYPS